MLENRDTKQTDEEPDELRVTDRRRIYLDDEGAERANEDVEQPNLKPSYVEELEARTKLRRNRCRKCRRVSISCAKQLQRETDETRQRLNRAADERAAREKAKFIAALLPVLDNLERAIDAAVRRRTARSDSGRYSRYRYKFSNCVDHRRRRTDRGCWRRV